MIVVVDNYDSFTYNLVQYLGELSQELRVVRNDQTTVSELLASRPDYLVLSPGPGNPDQAGICLDLIRAAGGRVPILGVCLGHQAIGQAFGAEVVRAPEIVHGKTSEVHHDGQGLFLGLPQPFAATRYHSLCLRPESIPATLRVTARTADGVVMGVEHASLAIQGVQFHPESILTRAGKTLLANFLAMYEGFVRS